MYRGAILIARGAAALVLTAVMALCATGPAVSAGTLPSPDARFDAVNHHLAPGDILLVRLFDGMNPLDSNVQVDSNGNITLPILGDVPVAGKLPREVADELTVLYKTYYVKPLVTVSVAEFGTIELFLFGPDFPARLVPLYNGSRLLDLLLKLADADKSVPDSPFIKLATTGKYRRLHLLRGGFDLTALMAQLQPADAVGLASKDTLSLQSPTSVARGGSLPAYANWRPWIEARKKDPQTQVVVLDPLRLTLEGELSNYNLELKNGDVIFIPSPERFVVVEGVSRPGRYELLGDETLGDVLRLAGTLDFDRDVANALVQRYNAQGRLSQIVVNLYPALEDVSAINNFELENRDKIVVAPREDRIFVLGAVQTGGAFTFTAKSSVLDYIAQAEGETTEANLAWLAVIRQPRDLGDPKAPAEVIQANFKLIHAGLPSCEDISLRPGDVIYVPPKGAEFTVENMLQVLSSAVTGFAITQR